MRTIKLTISYDGTNYVGWQIQPNGVSVQGLIEKALEKMTGEKNPLIGASRTDAGVHALGQVAHFKTGSPISCMGFAAGLNSLLPQDIAIRGAEEVRPPFHARKDAKGKRYLYRILASPHRHPLLNNRAWHVARDLDVTAMKKAAKCFIGEKDFSSFRAAGCASKDAVRKIDKIEITVCYPELCDGRAQDDMQTSVVNIEFDGSGFLRHMIRNIVGTIVGAGQGRFQIPEVKKIIAARDRKKAGVAAPACGLYLVKVYY